MRLRVRLISFGILLSACHRAPSSPADFRARANAVLAAAMSDSACVEGVDRLPPVRASDTLSRPGPSSHSDQRQAWIGRRVPGGWAGIRYGGGDAPPVILLKDTTQRTAALAALDTLLPPAYRLTSWPGSPIAQPAQWDLAELYDWLAYITSQRVTGRSTGINAWGFGLDNRILIGVPDVGSLRTASEWLHELRIPCDLVKLEVVGPIRLTSAIAADH